MNIKQLGLLLLVITAPLQAAGPIVHIYLAQQWLKSQTASQDFYNHFVVGTLLPDIRYVAQLAREVTHPQIGFNKVKDCVSLYPFMGSYAAFIAGIIFHSELDIVRFDYINLPSNIIYQLLYEKGVPEYQVPYFIKFVEDELYFDKIDRTQITALLNTITCNEQFFAQQAHIDHAQLEQWHQQLLFFLNNKPSEILAQCVTEGRSIYPVVTIEQTTLWHELFDVVINDPEIIKHVTHLIDDVEQWLITS